MAKKLVTLTEFIDDFDGEKIDEGLAETIEFAVQGSNYRMDLRPANADKFRKDLEKWIAAADKVNERRGGGNERRGRPRTPRMGSGVVKRSKEELSAIRHWATRHGYEVSDRGRIATDVIAAYEEAH